jgi:hypothetical protein
MTDRPTLKNGLPIFAYNVNDFYLAVAIGRTKGYEMIKDGGLKSGILKPEASYQLKRLNV